MLFFQPVLFTDNPTFTGSGHCVFLKRITADLPDSGRPDFFIRRNIIMNASVAIQVLPTVTDEDEVIRIVDEVIDYIRSTGLNYYVGPCETSIEGDYEELMEIVKNCQLVAAKAGCPAMNTYVKISFKPEGDVLTIDKKVTKHHQ